MFPDIGGKPRLFDLLALSIATTAVAQSETLLNQSNFFSTLNNNPSLNGSFRVIEDITLPPYWTPVGTLDSPASLKFNGSYHAISGLNATTTGNNVPTGLFGYLVDSWVHGMILNQPVVLSHGDGSETGAIAGRILRTNITDNLITGGSVETRGDAGSLSGQARYAHAGGITGSARLSRIEGNLNNAAVHTTGNYCDAGGTTGVQASSTTNGNLNTGAVSTKGDYANAGGTTGYQYSKSKTNDNLNTGAVRTMGGRADAGGTMGYQDDSTTSGNLNTGAVSTNGTWADAGGTTGYQNRKSKTNGNLNTGAVRTTGRRADAGGTMGYQDDSTTSGNLNTGAVSTNGTWADAGGTTGYQRFGSTTSGNLNTGAVRTTGGSAHAGGTMGYQERSTTSGNLNTGAVRTTGDTAHAGGTTGSEYDSTTSGNLYLGSVTAVSGTVNAVESVRVNESVLRVGLNGLSGTLWTAGDDSQLPMLIGINAVYRDLQRINGTRSGNNTFPVGLDGFANPGGSLNASLLDQTVWNVCDGYLPFPEAVGRDRAETVGMDCDEGGFACDCDLAGCPEPSPSQPVPTPTPTPAADCLFPSQPSGTIDHLLYDGQRYHGIVRSAASGLAYWAAYEDGNQVALEPCGVYGFADLSPSGSGIAVDAAASDGDNAYVVYHIPGLSGKMLALFTLSGQQYVSGSTLGLDRVVSLSVDIDQSRVLVNTGQDICRLPMENTGQEPECDGGLPGEGLDEEIQSVAGSGGDLYLLTYEAGTGYWVRTVLGSGFHAGFMVSIPSGTTPGAITPVLGVTSQHLHLLLVDRGLIIWRQYPLAALPVMLSDNWESEATAPMPRDITPAAMSLIPGASAEGEQGQVFVLGHKTGQPRYIRLTATDFAPSLDASMGTGAGGLPNINEWPWWGKVALGVGSTFAGSVVTGTLFVMGKHAYNHYMYPDKEDTIDKLAKKIRKRKQRGQGERAASLQLPMDSRNPFAFGPDGGSVINVDPVLTQDIAQSYEQPIPQYETIGPRPYELAVIQTRTTPQANVVTDAETTINPGHRHEIVDPATGTQVQAYATVPVPQPNPYGLPADGVYESLPDPIFLHQQPSQGIDTLDGAPLQQGQEAVSAQYQNIQGGITPATTGLEEIHQQLETTPDELDGMSVHLASEEPWYANTNPGVIASAPIYTELNKPSARRALQCMEARQSQPPGASQPASGSLDCVGPGQSPTYFHAMVQLEGSNPFSRLGKVRLKALARGFNLVFRGMEAVDSYVYDFPPGHPKRTRIHSQHVAEVLYGEHLSTAELFDSRIGDMEDPIIAFSNAMGNNIWHAFLVFRNSRTGEYNTLHIRQGNYYPEFMDKAATERYFHYEQKRIVGAISLTRLTELYGARLDLNLLRAIFRQRLGSKEMRYQINNQNCMTFSMLAFWATNFDWVSFLQKMGLANLQSPYHILRALAGSARNQPAIHSQENNLLPDWLAELNQNDE